jgi:hypothetical protein
MCSKNPGYDWGSESGIYFGDSIVGKWNTPIVKDSYNRRFMPLDGLSFSGQILSDLIVSEDVKNKLFPIIGQYGEFYPVDVVDFQYWWFNCTTKLSGVIDLENSDLGPVIEYNYPRKWIFKNIEYPPVFTTFDHDQSFGRLFCTEEVYRLSIDHEWIGMDFTLLYDSEREPFIALGNSLSRRSNPDWNVAKQIIKAKRTKALMEMKKRYPEGWRTSYEW